MYYVLGLLAIGVMIIVHEVGHYIMAKINGVKVLEFSIGFGPKIISHKGKETLFSISLLPFGGFVKMLGATNYGEEGEEEEIEEKDLERTFISKTPLQRLSIIIAGPLMNILLAIGIFSVFYSNFGFATTSIKEVVADSSAKEIGIEAGDKITEINGSTVFTTDDISIQIGMSKGSAMDIEYERAGAKFKDTITPKYSDEYGQYMIGVSFDVNKEPSLYEGFKHSLNETITIAKNNYKVLTNLVQGKGDVKTDIGGPVAIMKISSSAAKAGIWNLVYLIGLMSVGLGIINLLPVPILDGGTCILLLIEMITRRKVPDKVVGVLNTIGFVLLFGLMIFVTVKDILFPMNL